MGDANEDVATLPGEPQTEEELERLIDKELEDVDTNEQNAMEGNGELSEQERAAEEQLRKLREELEMDSTSPDEMDEYDIGARVRQLNEELAKEGPIEEKKNRKVNFHENIVSMEVPPPVYTEEEVALANEEVSKLEASDVPENNEGLGENPVDASRDNVAQERLQGDETDGGQAALEGNVEGNNLEMTGNQQSSEPSVIQPMGELEQISSAPMNNDPNGTDDPDSGRHPEGQREVGEEANRQGSDELGVNVQGANEQGANEQDINKQTPVQQEQVVAQREFESGAGSESQVGSESLAQNNPTDPNDLEVQRLTLRPKEENRTFRPAQNPGQESSQDQGSGSNGVKEVTEDEHVLIERGGKFFYVSVQELTPEERESLGVKLKGDESRNGSGSQSQLPSLQPKPPQRARPSTATGSESRNQQQRRQLPPRAMSAKTSKEYDRQERLNASYEEPFGNPRSKYGMTPEQKQHRREQARLRAQKLKEEKEREEQERREKEEMCEGVFRAWCEQKKEENARQKREEKERKKAGDGNKERDPQQAFEAWLSHKKEQKKVEQKVQTRMSAEEKEAYFMRSREDCERAFKMWVRSKNNALRESRSFSRAGALESKRRAQSSRKSRNLAKALEVAQAYRYNDYYGYRF